VTVVSLNQPVPISRKIPSRKWSLQSWRGGIGEATQFDEQVFTPEMIKYGLDNQIHSVLLIPAEAVLVSPQLCDKLLQHHRSFGDQMRFTFSQAGVGLTGCVCRMDLLKEMVIGGVCLGDLMAYRPNSPNVDYIIKQCNYKVVPQLYKTNFRYLADTRRSLDTIETFLRSTNGRVPDDPVEIVSAIDNHRPPTDKLPRELEIEINTDVSLRIKDYPHRRADIVRGPMKLAEFEKIVSDCRGYDDICLTIGGFGEPLSHPDLMDMIAAAKQAGVFGINIETDGRLLNGKLAERLLDSQVDIISVYLDANDEQLYRQVKGQDGFAEVVEQLEHFIDERNKRNGRGPLVLAHIVKTRETIRQMEDFYDRWKRKCGSAVIVGYNDFAGQIEDRAVMNMAPPRRTLCRRLQNCMSILADGSVTTCMQDFAGKNTIGNIFDQSVEKLWQSEPLRKLRTSHEQGDFTVNQLCKLCKEWHR
jgi:spiro-SPASM protein